MLDDLEGISGEKVAGRNIQRIYLDRYIRLQKFMKYLKPAVIKESS